MRHWECQLYELIFFLRKLSLYYAQTFHWRSWVFIMHNHSIFEEAEYLSCQNIPFLKKLSIYHAQTFHFWRAEYFSCTTIPLKKLEWHMCLNVQRMPRCQATWRTGIATVAPGSLSLSSRQGSEKFKQGRYLPELSKKCTNVAYKKIHFML